ncbi:MAG: homoserine dehydrogenase [Candidatus Obscuribacterales bacterium]|nr:homoserine dehydrogenase [Cyanobacteria bacterium SZAS LIN-5]RTL39757.1 MAG: homoserine dehydrogenase [Candidatus Melainabacteria bacterium]
MGRVVVGMIGLGTVGTGVVRLLEQQRHLTLKKVAVKELQKERTVRPACPVTTDVAEVIDDPEIEILIEVMGGEQPALDYIKRAIDKRKHIVTANKEVLAKHGPELFQLAKQKGVAIFFEASVAGGVPLISTISKGLEANKFSCVTGILNGTTNFILSKMEEDKESYAAALEKAQSLGFAEADPTNDVDGHDVAYKLSILSALSYQRFAKPTEIYREGIRAVSAEDMAQAQEFGYRIKLVGSTRRADKGAIDVRVHPMLVPLNHALASVSGSNNGIVVSGDAVGEIVMVGPGAGQMPTASAIVGDTINLASALQLPDFATYFQPEIEPEWAVTAAPGDWSCPFYLRFDVNDTPGVIGRIGTIFGEHKISIQSIFQRGVEESGARIVIFTHEVKNSQMETALAELAKCDFLRKLESKIRIFQPAGR